MWVEVCVLHGVCVCVGACVHLPGMLPPWTWTPCSGEPCGSAQRWFAIVLQT